MLQHNSRIRIIAKQNAPEASDKNKKKSDSEKTSEDDDTNNETKYRRFTSSPQVIQSMVELSGIEPLTSSLRTRRSPS
jgi:hypothetical protein